MEDPQKPDLISWQALQLFALYRLIIALMLLGIGRLNHYFQVLIVTNESLYLTTSITYLVFAGLWLALTMFVKKHYRLQTNLPIFSDVVFLIILISASGGILSGIGLLLIVIVAAHALLVPSRLAFFSAALATIGLILTQMYLTLTINMPLSLFTPVGLMGLVMFATAAITTFLSQKNRKKQDEINQKADQLALSQQLNTHIIFALESGILVLDPHHHIRLINTAARALLAFDGAPSYPTQTGLPGELEVGFMKWQQDQLNDSTSFISPNGRRIRCQFLSLGKAFSMGTLIFIYDVDKESERLQELKLASLGHLTANIAHELRNPLSAISHAAQLLNESKTLASEDKALSDLMKKHCNRINHVIQNVLSLSMNKTQHLEKVELIHWLEDFVETFSAPQYPKPQFTIDSSLSTCWVQVDTTQLTQIVNNLVENGLRYSQQHTGSPVLSFHIWSVSNDRIALDVRNPGESITPETAKYLFEPFYTTDKSGSGLGLYIAKALSEQNGIHLDYHPTVKPNQNQFRLIFPIGDPNHD